MELSELPDPGIGGLPEVNLVLLGDPIAMKQPRFVTRDRRGNLLPRPIVRNDNAKKKVRVQKDLLAILTKHGHLKPAISAGPVALQITFIIKPPIRLKAKVRKSLVPIYLEVKPDLDNYLKFLCDTMSGLVYSDDRQVARYDRCEAVYGDPPRTLIRAWRI